MAIKENLARFAEQVWNGTVAQIRRAPVVAAKWKSWAQAQSVPLAELSARATDGAISFISNIDRLNVASQDPVKGPLVDAAIAYLGNGEYTTLQVRNIMGQLRSACVALRDANKSTYAALIVALDAFILAVPAIPDEPGSETIWT